MFGLLVTYCLLAVTYNQQVDQLSENAIAYLFQRQLDSWVMSSLELW